MNNVIQQTKKTINLDWSTLEDIGLYEWSNQFFWPLSFQQFSKTCGQLFDFYNEIINASEETVQDVLLVLSKFLNFSWDLFNYQYVVQWSLDNNVKFKGNKNDLFFRLGTGRTRSDDYFQLVQPFYSFKIWRNEIFSTLKFNLQNGRFFPFLKGQSFINIGKICNSKKAYLEASNYAILYKHVTGLAKPLHNKRTKFIEKASKDKLREYFNCYIKLLSDLGIKFNPKTLSFIDRSIDYNCKLISPYYQAFLEKDFDNDILAAELGNALTRALCLVARRKGHNVVGVSHGNAVGYKVSPLVSLIDFPFISHYLVPTQGAQTTATHMLERCKTLSKPNVSIISANSEMFADIKKRSVPGRIGRNISTLLYVEYPLVPYRDFQSSISYAPSQLDLAIRIISEIRKMGIRVTMKIHPDRSQESGQGRLYREIADTVESTRFEEIIDKYDAIFFPHTGTTTLGYALATFRQIVYLDHPSESLDPEAKPLFDLRCRKVACSVDDENRIYWDAKDLQEAFYRPITPVDESFFNQYMRPII